MADRNPYLNFVVLLFLAFGVIGCGTTPASKLAHPKTDKAKKKQGSDKQSSDKKPGPAAQSFKIPIGVIHMVDKSGKFVLIKSNRATTLEPESSIMSYGPDAKISSQLRVSPARKGPYLTADFVEGTPSVGDMVMMIHTTTAQKQSTDGSASPDSDIQVLE